MSREGQRITAGNAIVRLDPRTRLIELPMCAGCGEIAPDCECGKHTTPKGTPDD